MGMPSRIKSISTPQKLELPIIKQSPCTIIDFVCSSYAPNIIDALANVEYIKEEEILYFVPISGTSILRALIIFRNLVQEIMQEK